MKKCDLLGRGDALLLLEAPGLRRKDVGRCEPHRGGPRGLGTQQGHLRDHSAMRIRVLGPLAVTDRDGLRPRDRAVLGVLVVRSQSVVTPNGQGGLGA